MAKHKPSGWDNVANWYDGWVGKDGSDHHRKLAIPTTLKLLNPQPDEKILDIGAGTGVLAKAIHAAGASYTGIDISRRLIHKAKQYHGSYARLIVGDARYLSRYIRRGDYDACVFMLSIQDMNPLDKILESAAYALRGGGRLAILMKHPCFRIPRQSGWGHDPHRKLQYRRLDHYLTPLNIPVKQHKRGTTITFHRPLSSYVNTLAAYGFVIDQMEEMPTCEQSHNPAQRRADAEIPLFMGIRARKLSSK